MAVSLQSPAMHHDTMSSSVIKGIHSKMWGEYRKSTEVIQTPKKEGNAAAPRHEGHQTVDTVLCGEGMLTRGVDFTEEGEVRVQGGSWARRCSDTTLFPSSNISVLQIDRTQLEARSLLK